ncbi:poly [ADP-ribose] polymerase 14-like [Lingula anatina]|uniref:Poly [ADP-ribose] polymerase n=1 Tax=Lingula anatina TaxID=7574 RepID=A0A1S3I3N9_LINAN|nr:poly [ADP-ribose] polymerase 14-like [Lingula anatina]|eukprot:XP_013392880.1 poly [ADP-ribose] polymerase 14-like [Lingula anatina]
MICVTVYDQGQIPIFIDEARAQSTVTRGTRKGRRQSMRQRQSLTALQRVVLDVYGASDKVAETDEDIAAFIKQNIQKEIIELKGHTLTQADIAEIRDLEVERGVTATIDTNTSTISIVGCPVDVSPTVSTIYKIIHRKIEDRAEEEKAAALQQKIQWCWIAAKDQSREPFDKMTNYRVELAHRAREGAVVYEIEGSPCKLDFSTMTETDCSKGIVTQVIREVKDPSLPSHWSPQPRDSDIPHAVHQVNIKAGDQEFNKVTEQFNAAFDSDGVRRKKIVQLLRIQNPHLYKQYKTYSAKLERENQGVNNEMSLFHGTSEANCDYISHQGFNRSFGGLNVGAIFGKGVYFAKKATYSAQPSYCKPNAAGEQFMFLAKVLVGSYTKGHRKMLTPPPKDPDKPLETYNSVVDNTKTPTIFVIFYDAQAYPEYLIKFKA